MARHRRRHTESTTTTYSAAQSNRLDDGPLAPQPDTAVAPPPIAQTRVQPPDPASQPLLGEMSLDQEPFISLNWPDSEDLLNSILSAEFTSLPALEILPSQSIVRGAREPDPGPASPWLTSNINQRVHGGNHAVRNLSQIINSLVCRPGRPPEQRLTIQVRRYYFDSSKPRTYQCLPGWLPPYVLHSIRSKLPSCTPSNICV